MIDNTYIHETTDPESRISVPQWAMKVVLIGDPEVGKTTLRRTYVGQRFRQNYLPTLGADFSVHKVVKDNQRFIYTLWDLSGQRLFFNVHPQYYVGSHGAIVVADVKKPDPISRLTTWIDKYIQYAGRHTGPIMIIFNKIDLLTPQEEIRAQKKLEDTLERLSIYYHNKFQLMGYLTSAKTAENVKLSFNRFFEEMALHYQSPEKFDYRLPPVKTESPRSYLIRFDQVQGPMIFARYPSAKRQETAKEITSATRLTTTIDFDRLVEGSHQTGIAPWSDPAGSAGFISFAMENGDARGGHNLYIIVISVVSELKQQLSDKFSLIEGELHHCMNQVHEFLLSNRSEETGEDLIDLDSEMYNYILTTYLEDLTQRITSVLHN